MFELKKWDPFRELSSLQREMDEFFRRTFGGLTPGFLRKGEWYPAIESYMHGGRLIVHADLPGIDPKDVDISVVGNQLTIKGERKSFVEEKEVGYLIQETCYGSFERTLTLPEGVDVTNIRASYKNGILELTMPAKAEALPKKIKVEVEEVKRAA